MPKPCTSSNASPDMKEELSHWEILLSMAAVVRPHRRMWVALVTRGFEIHARQRAMKAAVAEMDAKQLQVFAPGW